MAALTHYLNITATVSRHRRTPFPGHRHPAPLAPEVAFGLVAVLVLTLLGLDGYFILADYYARGWVPGVIATVPMVAVVTTLLWLSGRELRGYLSLRTVDQLSPPGPAVTGREGSGDALALAHRVAHLYRGQPALKARFEQFLAAHSDTHSDAEVLALFSRDVLRPLDDRAYAVISRYGIQSAALTAVSSFAALDMLFTLWRNSRMLREVANVYGVRPGFVRNLDPGPPCPGSPGGVRRQRGRQ